MARRARNCHVMCVRVRLLWECTEVSELVSFQVLKKKSLKFFLIYAWLLHSLSIVVYNNMQVKLLCF